MIPNTIHYCWFGNAEPSDKMKKCMKSWRKYCPGFEVKLWNENNFNVSMNAYTKYCFENKKWAFLSDYVRLYAIYSNGGVYFDTDVELIKPIDKLLENKAFFGFETTDTVNTGLGFGAERGSEFVKSMMRVYEDSSVELGACPTLNTKALASYGLKPDGTYQSIYGALILPVEYMNPYENNTGRLNVTNNTISIHWYAKSWMSRGVRVRSALTKPFHRLLGDDCFVGKKKHNPKDE